ncbi:hypothetical protein TNCV_4194481 [Trichonephila clavipes]|nr:hypothetical protein TNCV_4194481 [Trichonephila clavipes]
MSDGRKRLSGAQYIRKRVKKQVQIKKQAGSLLSYLQGMKRNDDDTGILEAASNLNYEADQDTMNPLPRIVPVELTPRTYKESTPGTSTEPTLGTSTEPTPEISKETFGTITNSDPGSWPTSLSEAEIYFLVKEGLPQPSVFRIMITVEDLALFII